jgi:hypothetical protein
LCNRSAQHLVGEGFNDAGELVGGFQVGVVALPVQHHPFGMRQRAGKGVEPFAEMGGAAATADQDGWDLDTGVRVEANAELVDRRDVVDIPGLPAVIAAWARSFAAPPNGGPITIGGS